MFNAFYILLCCVFWEWREPGPYVQQCYALSPWRTATKRNSKSTAKRKHTAQNSPKQYSLWWIVNLCDAAKYGQDQAIACTLSMPPRSLIIKCTVLRSKRKGFRSHKLIFVSDLRPACAICAEWTKEPNENGRQTTIKSTIRSREKRNDRQ